MKRLPNGMGAVVNLGNGRRKPYAARIRAGISAKGGTIYKYLGYYSTKQEALQALTDYNKNPYDVTAAEATVADMWEVFKQRRFKEISKSGCNIYTAAYKHLKQLHNTPIKDIKTYQIQSLIDNLDRSWQSKSHVQTLMNQLFNIAMELDIATKNYATFVKIGEKPQSTKHKMFTQDEIDRLFKAVFAEEFADTVLILIYTGMRPSELLNVRISDVHIEDRYMVGGMKTKAGKDRVIPINDKVYPFILKRYNTDNNFLIEHNGLGVSYPQYKKAFLELMARLEMEHFPHDGRHTFASLANTAGVNETAVKLIMGHTSQDITERVYTHKAISELLTAVNQI